MPCDAVPDARLDIEDRVFAHELDELVEDAVVEIEPGLHRAWHDEVIMLARRKSDEPDGIRHHRTGKACGSGAARVQAERPRSAVVKSARVASGVRVSRVRTWLAGR